jgi:hypothetical protein
VSALQHQRLAELSRELRLSAVPDLYSVIAQSAAAKSASFADFLEEIVRAERDARWARTREMFARVARLWLCGNLGRGVKLLNGPSSARPGLEAHAQTSSRREQCRCATFTGVQAPSACAINSSPNPTTGPHGAIRRSAV